MAEGSKRNFIAAIKVVYNPTLTGPHSSITTLFWVVTKYLINTPPAKLVILFGSSPLSAQATQSSHIHMHTLPHKQVGVNLFSFHFPRQEAMVSTKVNGFPYNVT